PGGTAQGTRGAVCEVRKGDRAGGCAGLGTPSSDQPKRGPPLGGLLCSGGAAGMEVPPLRPTIDALNGKAGTPGAAGGAPIRSNAAASYSGGASNGNFS